MSANKYKMTNDRWEQVKNFTPREILTHEWKEIKAHVNAVNEALEKLHTENARLKSQRRKNQKAARLFGAGCGIGYYVIKKLDSETFLFSCPDCHRVKSENCCRKIMTKKTNANR